MCIPWRTHMRWMAEAAEPGGDMAQYQSAVLAGLDQQRKRDLAELERAVEDAPGTHVSTVWNMRKHRHESRFKRFYDDAQKVELSGPEGSAVQLDVVAKLSDAELKKLVEGE